MSAAAAVVAGITAEVVVIVADEYVVVLALEVVFSCDYSSFLRFLNHRVSDGWVKNQGIFFNQLNLMVTS